MGAAGPDDRRVGRPALLGGPLLAVLVLLGGASATLAAGLGVDRDAPDSPRPEWFGAREAEPEVAYTEAWGEVVDGAREPFDPTSSDPCRAGDPSCLDAVVAEMEARLERRPCAHTAPFAFTYLEMTRGVTRRAGQPGFFEDPAALAHVDAFFAAQYFAAFDHWQAGRLEAVPGAWQVAFEAADRRAVSAAADLFLGMNAHISRDLAFAVEEALVADPALAERRDDFLRVNEVIGEVKSPMLQGASRRFDPALAVLDLPLPPQAGVDTVELIERWREEAFDAGRRMAEADSAAARDAVAAEVERESVAAAAAVLNADALVDVGLAPDERARYCTG